jgi:hypothetical protein
MAKQGINFGRSGDRTYDASIGAQGGAVDRRGEWAADERDQRRYLFRRDEPLDDGRWPTLGKELLLD